jgi:hypothetical protein
MQALGGQVGLGWIKENQRSFCSGPHLVDENRHYVLTQSPFVLAM